MLVKILRIKLLLLSMWFVGCASLGGAAGVPYSGLSELKQDTAQVYIYRPSRFVMGMAIPTIKVNGIKATGVRNGSYVVYQLPPGMHKISILRNANWMPGNVDLELDLEDQNRYFFRLTTGTRDATAVGNSISLSVGGTIQEVSEEFAITELPLLKFTGVWR